MSAPSDNSKDNRYADPAETEKLSGDGFKVNLEKGNLTNNLKNGDSKNCTKDLDDRESADIERVLRNTPLNEETTCGYWLLKGSFLQKFANKKAYVVLYGIVGCVFSMTYAYFNGTITTIEKRFKIPSKNTGIISVGNDISQLFASSVLSYYAGKGHRPRWIGFGILTILTFCVLTAVPHFLYGPGEDAMMLTTEYGATADVNSTMEALEEERSKTLCKMKGGKGAECEESEGSFAPQVILFIAQFISGIGGSLYYTLGVSYMDDNIKKSKTPALLTLSYFMRMLGPAIGYALASFCLRVYISPNLTPVISNSDPRWLGAWWLGWLILGALLFFTGIFLSMFPAVLPRAAARKTLEEQKLKKDVRKDEDPELAASFKDMIKTFKKLITNPTLMCNNIASILYLIGYTPYLIFTPKYIEIQYRQSAATSNLVTGTVAVAFSAIGVLGSGFVISKYKPRARYMAAWNVVVGVFSVVGILGYSFLGCPGNDSSTIINIPTSNSLSPTCNSACGCDYVRYSPVCGEDGNTYISPCHAGCKSQIILSDNRKFFYDCSCIGVPNKTLLAHPIFERLTDFSNGNSVLTSTSLPPTLQNTNHDGQAIPGGCPVNCFKQFVMFLAVMCFLQFVGATGVATNFFVSVRCVLEKDKTAAMGFSLMLMSLFAFIPSPIFFGWLLDRFCLVWGKTCTSKGNCWFYDAEGLRYKLNIIGAIFVFIGTIFDVSVWYYVKDLKIFEAEVNETEMQEFDKEEVNETEMQEFDKEEEANNEKKAEM